MAPVGQILNDFCKEMLSPRIFSCPWLNTGLLNDLFLSVILTDAHTVADVDYKWKIGKSNGVEIVSSKMAQFDLLRVQTINDASTNSKGNNASNIHVNNNAKMVLHKFKLT